MAVCNLFTDLSNSSGNFLMFSQYVEDITRNYTDGDNWKVVPTQFVALNIDYTKSDILANINSNIQDLNINVPKYFQNYFENSCAHARVNNQNWNSKISRNLFWNSMFNAGFVSKKQYASTNEYYVPEIMYYGDINMHSYNEHQGMGYGEIYCYIPTDAPKMNCQVVENFTSGTGGRHSYQNTNNNLEGLDEPIGDYSRLYYYNDDYVMEFDNDAIERLQSSNESKYNINTIVVLYSIFNKLNNDWQLLYTGIPLGMYFAGKFENGKLSNEITKHVTTSYDTGTSYGLRICTRLSVTSTGKIVNTDIIVDDSGYTNMCQLMTSMNKNLSKMLDISKDVVNTNQLYKDTLSIIKNNRANVPYVKNVNGVDCWFVNGRLVSNVNATSLFSEYDESTIRKRLDNLMDNNEANDYSYIDDNINGPDYSPYTARELAELVFNKKEWPDKWDGDTFKDADKWPDCICGGSVYVDVEVANSSDVANTVEALLRN